MMFVDIKPEDTKILTQKEVRKLLLTKGYQEVTFRDYEKNLKNIAKQNQVSACKYNLTRLPITMNGKFYLIPGIPALQVRAWEEH